jgi:poly(A) polymerase
MVRQGPHWIETATFRTDLDYRDGRHPDRIEFATAKEDAQRRDFTINGLFYDPLEEEVIDYVGGRDDLEAGIIRAIGPPEERFAEDHLRMLRAARFATRLGFDIEPATAEAVRHHAPEIVKISPERIREELEKTLSQPSRAQAVKWIADLSLIPHLGLGTDWPDSRVDVAVNVARELPGEADFVLSTASLLHDCPSTQVKEIGRALRCSNQQIDDLAWLIANLDRPTETGTMPLAQFKRLIAHSRFDDLLALYKAVHSTLGQSIDGIDSARRRLATIPEDEIAPPPLVTGDDLIELGLEPGPLFGKILDQLYDAQLNNELTERSAALERMLKLISDPNG